MKKVFRVFLFTVILCLWRGVGVLESEAISGSNPNLEGPTTLPLKRVVLYKHGVGYFEHHGLVSGNEVVEFYFRSEDMNDVLKSLTILDLGGGTVPFVIYDSQKPTDTRLKELFIKLPDKNVLTSLLRQLKGVKVQIEVGRKRISGTILGTETTTKKVGDAIVTSEGLVLFLEDGKVVTFDLTDISSVKFSEEEVNQELKDLFDILSPSRRRDLKTLSIQTSGEGDREVVIGYTIEAPVWKTSYRVVFEEDKKPLLQGWAIVDNVTEVDWKDISLSLISGLPISFRHDLYTPRAKERPEIKVEEKILLAPPELEEGIYVEKPSYKEEALRFAPQILKKETLKALQREKTRIETIDIATDVVERGELFEYKIKDPVSIKKGSSALVPILQERFDGERVLVFNQEIREKNPMSCILFKNTTGLVLEGGPIVVIEDEAYIGEAMLDTIRPGEERYIPFSIELGCKVDVSCKSSSERIHAAKVVNGYLHFLNYDLKEWVYHLTNNTHQAVILVLEHKAQKGWDLVETPEPIEKTQDFYRFRIPMEPGERKEFCVKERGEVSASYHIVDLERDAIEVFIRKKALSEKMRNFLNEVLELKGVISLCKRDIEKCEKEIEDIHKDEDRIRKNLSALGMSPEEKTLREKYVASLIENDKRLNKLQGEMKRLIKKKEDLRASLSDLVTKFEIEEVF
jgi:hypothetical protein